MNFILLIFNNFIIKLANKKWDKLIIQNLLRKIFLIITNTKVHMKMICLINYMYSKIQKMDMKFTFKIFR